MHVRGSAGMLSRDGYDAFVCPFFKIDAVSFYD